MRNFWTTLRDAFENEEGFTVIFHLKSGKSFNISTMEPKWNMRAMPEEDFIEGSVNGQSVVIALNAIEAYEIEL